MRGNIGIIGIVVVALLLAAIYLFAPSKEVPLTVVPGSIATTTVDEKPFEPETMQLRMHLGEKRGGLDISILPIEVTEDSRCPMEVQCVWAGRIVVRASLASASGEAPQLFELGKTITTETRSVTLVEVLPIKRVTAVVPQDYEFVFEIKKRADR